MLAIMNRAEPTVTSPAVSIDVTPADAVLGAEIEGPDVSRGLDAADSRVIEQAVWDHVVVCLRGQSLSPAQLVAFGQGFGALEPHVLEQYHHPDHPEVLVLSNVVEGGKPRGFSDAGAYWHSDLSYKAEPTKYTVLHAKEIPATGGDTLFVNGTAVYEALDDGLRDRVDGLRAIHSYAYRHELMIAKNRLRKPLTAAQQAAVPDVAHPAVRTHPDTGRKALYVNPGFTKGFEGLSDSDGEALLAALFDIALRPEFSYRHKWQLGDLLIWDNRCSMHLAAGGYGPDQRRVMHRVTVRGTAPF